MVKLTTEQFQSLIQKMIKEELEEGLFDMFRKKTPDQQQQELIQKLAQKLHGGISTQELATLYDLLSKPVGKAPETSHIKTASGEPYFREGKQKKLKKL